MKACEAQGTHLDTTLNLFLQRDGIDIKKLQGSTDLSVAFTDKDLSLTGEEESKMTTIAKHSLSALYGVAKFSMKEHGEYPSVGKDHTSWPSKPEGGRSVPVHRFDFREPHSSPRNNDSFVAWVDHSLAHGPDMARITDLPNTVFNRKSVTDICIKHYNYLKRRYRETSGSRKAPLIAIKRKGEGLDEPDHGPFNDATMAGGIPGASEYVTGGVPGAVGYDDASLLGFGNSLHDGLVAAWPTIPNPTDYNDILAAGPTDGEPETSGGPVNTRESHRSRRNLKVTIRTRKRDHLPPEDEKYRGSKYDSYFTYGAMSDDEAMDEVQPNGEKLRKFYAREWDFASDELIAIREAIDRVPDPVTSKKTERLRGLPKPGPPHKSNVLRTGMRTWMIQTKVMDQNKHWIRESRVYESGPEWNEPEPVAKRGPPASKRFKTEAPPDLSLAQQTQGNWLQAKREVESYAAARRTDGNEPGPSM
ncbi:hypothetical protein FRC07_005542 [Ceratobasidium sp. 392]|nr:hypothetical protein FRC07_005542 [Ceratobasidium sp. 392]